MNDFKTEFIPFAYYCFIVLKCCLSIFFIQFIKNFAELNTSLGFLEHSCEEILHTFNKVNIDSSSVFDILSPHKAILILLILLFVGEEFETLNFKNSSITFLRKFKNFLEMMFIWLFIIISFFNITTIIFFYFKESIRCIFFILF